MDARRENEPATAKNPRHVEVRRSDRELVSTRTFNGAPRLVFDAWTKPDLFRRWWFPKSFGITVHSCEMDVRVGGTYRLMLGHGDSPPMPFFGRYLEVIPGSRLVWTNDEAGESGPITTVTFEEQGGKTLVTMRDLHASKQALDEAIASGSTSCVGETFDQLNALLDAPG